MNNVDQFYSLFDVKYDYTSIYGIKITQGSRTDFDIEMRGANSATDDMVFEVVDIEVELGPHGNYVDGNFDIEISLNDGYYLVHVMYARRTTFNQTYETNSLRTDDRNGVTAFHDLIMTIEDRMGALLPTLVYDALNNLKERMEARELADQMLAKINKDLSDAIVAEVDKMVIADIIALAGIKSNV